jgi:UDP-N-acetylmuramate dehydrogenase
MEEQFLKNVLLAKYTSFKIGGPAKYFFVVKTEQELIETVKIAKKLKLSIFILGGGSNLLISDKGFEGLVIKIEFADIKIIGNTIVSGAGANITKIAYESAKNELSGLEWAAGMPGTVGGAVYGNAQAFGIKISNAVKNVRALSLKDFKIKNFTNKQCNFSLKNSIFKKNKKLVILSVELELNSRKKEDIDNKIKEFLNYRQEKHPMNFPSAGSVFVNPEIKIKDKKLLEKFPELNEYNEKGLIPAGFMISKCGLLGKKIGNVQISDKHANFIINLGGAKAKDVLKLIKIAKQKVKKRFNINLETEIQLIGF